MKLLTKFNLILLVLSGTGGLMISQFAYTFLINNARREVLQEAELMMASARSVRDYTAADLAPLLEQNPQHKERFLPETVPAFGAISTFNRLREKYPDYTYHEATLNPTNPAHRAVDWEANIIGYFRDHPEQKQLIGEREAATGPSLYLATPMAAEPPCLECHSRPALAPPAMIETYGSDNGFENHIKQLHGVLLKYSPKDQDHRGEYKKVTNHVKAFGPDGKSLGVVFESATPFETP